MVLNPRQPGRTKTVGIGVYETKPAGVGVWSGFVDDDELLRLRLADSSLPSLLLRESFNRVYFYPTAT